MNYSIRKATKDDICPAFDLALRVFMEFEAPIDEAKAVEYLRTDFARKKTRPDIWISGGRLMYVALDHNTVVGMIDARENGHIQSFYVDSAYHRRGIGTELMNHMVCELKLRGFDNITLDSSPYGLPFYLKFGFSPTGVEQKTDGFIGTPMAYKPNEIWDVLDENGNKTGRYAERGRKMADGDYHLVVHVWKHNSKGEWLIDKRTPARGTSIDGKWETTGGSAIAGEDSLAAALREAKEELGVELDPQSGTLFNRINRNGNDGHTWFQESWVFEWNGSIEDIRLQKGETCDARWATADEIREMMKSGDFLSKWFYPYFDEMVEKWEATKPAQAESELHRMSIPFDSLSLIRQKDVVVVWRAAAGAESYAMKSFDKSEYRREIESDDILQSLGIPTLEMEDIERGTYRLGTAEDMADPKIAGVVADLYKMLHQNGRGYANTHPLYDECDCLTTENIKAIQERTGTGELPVWRLIEDHFDRIASIAMSLPRTLTYNDFDYTNLVVARDGTAALMLDYNMLGKGYVYSDVRNICWHLENEETRAAFLSAYGGFDEKEVAVDNVTSVLTSLHIACRREHFPDWANVLLTMVRDGRLQTAVEKLLNIPE